MEQIPKEWVEFLRKQFPVGSRIQLQETLDESKEIAGGTGKLEGIEDDGSFLVRWSDTVITRLKPGEGRFTVLPPATQLMKLYMPLTADLFEPNEWGDMDNEPTTELDGRSLRGYEDKIVSALVRYRDEKEAERGIMHWYHENDGVDRKVRSVVFTVEERDHKLWGVAECRVTGELTPQELDKLKEYISGQASDGWGEGFEQHEIKVDDDGELFVHLWSCDEDWSMSIWRGSISESTGLPCRMA